MGMLDFHLFLRGSLYSVPGYVWSISRIGVGKHWLHGSSSWGSPQAHALAAFELTLSDSQGSSHLH